MVHFTKLDDGISERSYAKRSGLHNVKVIEITIFQHNDEEGEEITIIQMIGAPLSPTSYLKEDY